MYEIKLKPGHPTGTYHRAGMTFTAEPVRMEKVPEAVAKDPWLIVSKIEEPKKEPPPPPAADPPIADPLPEAMPAEEAAPAAEEKAGKRRGWR